MSRLRHDWSTTSDHAASRSASSRTRLLEASVGLVEDVRSTGAAREPIVEGFSPGFQVEFRYRRMHLWQVERDDVVGYANQVLFVTCGER